MSFRQESLPQANIYSSKILFEQTENRNQKRINQILKRKKALSTRNKTIKFDEEKSDVSPKNEKEEIDINSITKFNESIYCYNFNNEDKQKNLLEKKNIINDINNNSTNHNSSILNKDSQEKEVNVSNLDDDTSEILMPNKIENNINKSNDKNNKSIINIDIIDYDESFNLENKENNYLGSNEFAIKYLCSSLDSFVKLDNHLVAKAKFQNNCFTDSYSQALELNYEDNNMKSLFHKNYLVTDIIKEEKEGETPLKIIKKKEKIKYKNIFDENNEELEIMKRVERRRAYSRRIRNNFMKKNSKDELGSNIAKKNIDKFLNKSKSCKKFKKNNTLKKLQVNELNDKNSGLYKSINIKKNSFYIKRKSNLDDISKINNLKRRTICGFKTKIKLNNSFNFNINKRNNKNNNYLRKTLPVINSSKNLYNKNQNLLDKMSTSMSNLNIFKKNFFQKKIKNNINSSACNIYTNIRKDKIRSSKSAKRINDISKNYNLNNKENNNIGKCKNLINMKLSLKLKNIYSNNNIKNNYTLKKNPTMGNLTYFKKNNTNKKNDENSKIIKKENLNKTFLISSKKSENSLLNNTISYKNIKCKKCLYNIINFRSSMPFKSKAKKIVKNFLNNENNVINKLKINSSCCYLTNNKKNS